MKNNGEKIPLNVVILKCEGYNIPYQEIIFGTIHIMEGMANLIQNLVYPHLQDASPYNPYHIAVDVVDMWKSHATLTPLAKQDCPLWLQYD